MSRVRQMLFSYVAEKNAKYHPQKAFIVDEQKEWNNGQPFLLGFSLKFPKFPGVQQQFAVALWFVIVMGAQTVFRDMQVMYE